MFPGFDQIRIGIIGLGYVGFPLAVEFARKFPVTGFDVNQQRVDALQSGHDATLEVSPEEMASAVNLKVTSDAGDLAGCNTYIVTVPTPIDKSRRPDLAPLLRASETVGAVLNRGDLVIYESTVYPGATEEDCIPVLEQVSGLRLNQDFFAGYSPERINPGDKLHRLPDIRKVTSGSNPETAERVDRLYASIISAGTFPAESIRVAEAAKVIENTQRDINIALINELAIIFSRLGISTGSVLEAAGTKWNFLPFQPGLVGGHCIGVDPYYLTHKAEAIGYHPEIILAGRRMNDGMGKHVASQAMKALIKQGIVVNQARVLVLGVTFKENCPDIRNTKVIDVVAELQDYGVTVDIWDPWASPQEVKRELGVDLTDPARQAYDAMLFAVAHDEFLADGGSLISRHGKPGCVVYDLKGVLPAGQATISL